MRILVTGGSGFLGSAFVRAALAQGHSVAVLTRPPPVAAGLRSASTTTTDKKSGPHARHYNLGGSIAEPPWVEMEKFKPEACVHAAWIATPGVYLESPENHDWVHWSCDFLARLPALGVRHVVALGTCIEYQITGQPLREDTTPIVPTSLYARCKHELHQLLRVVPFADGPSSNPQSAIRNPQSSQSLLTSAATTLTWARIFYPYGEAEHPARLMSSLLAKFRAGEPVTLKTPRSVKDYLHADDVAAALLTVIERRFDGAVNVGTGEGVTVETIARRLAELVGRPELVQVPAAPITDPLDFVVAEATRLRSLGWRPQVTLEAGLRRLVEARRQ